MPRVCPSAVPWGSSTLELQEAGTLNSPHSPALPRALCREGGNWQHSWKFNALPLPGALK